MKKLINRPEAVVMEMCQGLAAAHPELEFLPKYKVVKRRQPRADKVSLISGGGSGHEPAHAGFVGGGMLDAAVCGDVFASPSQIQVYQAIKATAGEKGALLIIKNYSGDMMNFQNAAYLAELDGIAVDYVKVADDIAVRDSLYTVGRRGVAGTVFVHKIAGAAAEAGLDLAAVKRIAEKAADSVRSLGFALTSCTVPAKGTPTFALGEREIEYGVGIHGEPGICRAPLTDAAALAKKMTAAILDDLGAAEGAQVAVLVNGFGATPLMELYLFYHCVARELAQRGIRAVRVFVGNYMTSIDMAGASLSILKLDGELKAHLTAPSEAPAFKVSGDEPDASRAAPEAAAAEATSYREDARPLTVAFDQERVTLEHMIFLIDKMAEVIIENEVPFCELDAHAGDGDFGMSVAKGFKQLKRAWADILAESKDIGGFLSACSLVIMEHCGGASGPIWGFAFKAAAASAAGKRALGVGEFAAMLQAAVSGIQKVGERSFGRGAVVGDKTLMDALIPCADAWTDAAKRGLGVREAFRRGAAAAVEGAEKTKEIVARMGRAGTVGARSIGYPDAGAHALGVIFTALSACVQEDKS